MINLAHTEHIVSGVRIINDSLFELEVDRNGIRFEPGDCVALYTDTGESRPYSIASGTSEAALRFLIRVISGGEVSPWIMARKREQTIRMTPPFGWFRPGVESSGAPSVFFATGTGVAPFLSYMKTHPNHPPLLCLYGVRKRADAFGFEEMRGYCKTRLAVSRQTSGHHYGRITGLLDEVPTADHINYYCCGREKMIENVSDWLAEKGIGPEQIHREVFFHG